VTKYNLSRSCVVRSASYFEWLTAAAIALLYVLQSNTNKLSRAQNEEKFLPRWCMKAARSRVACAVCIVLEQVGTTMDLDDLVYFM
jgi:hypothetical protein